MANPPPDLRLYLVTDIVLGDDQRLEQIRAALLAGAAGVHLGQSDMPVGVARARLGPEALIGLSIEELSQVERAELAQVDYLAASPVYATTTKPDVAAPLGLEGVRELRARCEAPLVGIGGITEATAAAVIGAGGDGVGAGWSPTQYPPPSARARRRHGAQCARPSSLRLTTPGARSTSSSPA